jgi:hypothetical protein
VQARPRLEGAAIAAAFLVCGAFIASFVLGLGRGVPAAESPASGAAAAETTAPAVLGRVEVLNASGRPGLARAATDRLRGGGFDVVFFGNASGFDGDSTLIIDRVGNETVARAAARYLGLGIIRTQRDTTLFVDATIVVGRDWR